MKKSFMGTEMFFTFLVSLFDVFILNPHFMGKLFVFHCDFFLQEGIRTGQNGIVRREVDFCTVKCC